MQTTKRVLIVDDDHGITKSLGDFLQRSGYQVGVAVNGVDALEQMGSFAPHIILLDIEMPWMDGREFLRQLRRGGNWTPVIMLTIINTSADMTQALNEGADDYIDKPFDPNELLARMGAVLRRVQPGQAPLAAAEKMGSGDLRLNRSSRTAYLCGKPLNLSFRAFSVLEYLMLHRDEVITRERLMDTVWGLSAPILSRAVDSRISELRRALEDDRTAARFIETVTNVGYRFVGEVEALP